MKKQSKPLFLLYILCTCLIFSACNPKEAYRPSLYTKEEVLCLYYENLELFESLVRVISSNEEFYEKGRINEHTDADIISPDDEALIYFDDGERKVIDTFFGFKPYMILYDYARRFVKITFIAAETESADSYTLLFWIANVENSEVKFNNHKKYLAQRYVVEDINSGCIMFYMPT